MSLDALLLPCSPRYATAKRRIEQCPTSDAPPVPRGECGDIVAFDDDLVVVDFDEPYGAVLCDASDVRLTLAPTWRNA